MAARGIHAELQAGRLSQVVTCRTGRPRGMAGAAAATFTPSRLRS
jgi:hypothetical protein